MHITAKVDYAVRTLIELAAAGPSPSKAEFLAQSQAIPHKFLEAVLADLRRGGLVNSRRGPDGGYWLARPAEDITIADVIRTVEGPLASVRGERPEDVDYGGPAAKLQDVWIAVRVNLRAVLENVSLADVANGQLPGFLTTLTSDPGAWERRTRPATSADEGAARG
ncbi:Rrf2 family transcriptional regulator [Rhodococcus sp. ACS1]|uniref:Rrf2 family protein n=1 Tax=Rhodococcus koreensis TaxID=99653 RepID=A0A1H4UDK0_9NOCA|nr:MULTISPECIES: Rrf2 family transcriptional regulator [Rhodococcus]PBC45807.1 Rrf2 family transcriptional regulator [Rhodococcus sp. ACS1]SEC66448.1 Rrf2 family protein [Rhodococcus koreensis]